MCSSAAVIRSDSTAVLAESSLAGRCWPCRRWPWRAQASLAGTRALARAWSCRSRWARWRLSTAGSAAGSAGADGGHDLEEEVVAVAAGGDGRLAEPAVELGAAGRGEVVDDAVGLDLLRLALGVDQAVTGEPLEYLVEVADVQPAPLIADGLLEAAFQLVAVGRLGREQGQDRVMQGHEPYLVTR